MADEKTSQDDRREKLPIDARLLADAIIELNISRRSVGMYPADHPITRESISRAFEFLQKLFELRPSITLAVAKDVLMVDENVLDRRNPVFREFAASLHQRGIAAVTFFTGVAMEDLQGLHELLVDKEIVPANLLQRVKEKGIRSIGVMPLDLSKFIFVEGGERRGGETELWETYVTGLVEGRLAGDDAEGVVLSVPPEKMAFYINESLTPDKAHEETYDRVITSYLRKREHIGIRPDLFNRFLGFVESLSPDLKQQFLGRAFSRPALAAPEVEQVLSELSSTDIDRVMKLFMDHSSVIPESVRNLLDKLETTKETAFQAGERGGIIDDIDLGDEAGSIFGEDGFKAFVTDDYREDLKKMLAGPRVRSSVLTPAIRHECSEEAIQGRFSEILLELIDTEALERDDYLHFLTGISGLVGGFLDTGRFRAISDIYNTVYAHTLTGRYREEARSMLDFYFRSRDFTERFIAAVKLWGRFDREGVRRIVRVQQGHLIGPLFEALIAETDAAVRRFLLEVLAAMGREMQAEAVRRLGDPRWYVVRNMLYLIRETGGKQHLQQIRKYARHDDHRISIEAIRTLLHFGTPDSVSYLRRLLTGRDESLREQAVHLAGVYRCEGVLPQLLDFLQKRNFLGTDSPFRIAVVKALGDIGDPGAVPVLMKVCSSKTLLYRSANESLKVEIFRSLAHYPREAVVPLLELGLQSGNEEARAVCALLLNDEGGRHEG